MYGYWIADDFWHDTLPIRLPDLIQFQHFEEDFQIPVIIAESYKNQRHRGSDIIFYNIRDFLVCRMDTSDELDEICFTQSDRIGGTEAAKYIVNNSVPIFEGEAVEITIVQTRVIGTIIE